MQGWPLCVSLSPQPALPLPSLSSTPPLSYQRHQCRQHHQTPPFPFLSSLGLHRVLCISEHLPYHKFQKAEFLSHCTVGAQDLPMVSAQKIFADQRNERKK